MKILYAAFCISIALVPLYETAAEVHSVEPSPCVFPNASERPIQAKELLDCDAKQLSRAREEIVNEVERANVKLIEQFEKHLIDNPEGEFGSAYGVLESRSSTGDGIAVRQDRNTKSDVVGYLHKNCEVFSDSRMEKDDGWIYVRSSQCEGAPGPAGGYVPEASIVFEAG